MPFSAGSDAVMALDGTTQIDRPSPRRVKMSRAACNAMVASLACSEPQCLWASPLRLRIKTSHSGVFGVVIPASSELLFGGLRRLPTLALFRIGGGRLTHPRAVGMRLAPRRHAVAVAGAIARQHRFEFGPVDLAISPVTVGVLLHVRIGNAEAEVVRLRHRGIDEFLAQLVVGEALDLPS